MIDGLNFFKTCKIFSMFLTSAWTWWKFLFLVGKSQENLIDGIAAIVGEHVILKSDVAQLTQMTAVQQNLDPRFDVEKLEKLQKQRWNQKEAL